MTIHAADLLAAFRWGYLSEANQMVAAQPPRTAVYRSRLLILRRQVLRRLRSLLAWRVVLLLSLLVMPALSHADESLSSLAPADTTSPRATLKSFIDSCNEIYELIQSERYFNRSSPYHRPHVMRALDCLDLSEVPEYERMERGTEAAVYLKELLDRAELPPYEEIPGTEEIQAEDGEPRLTRWQIPGTRITIAQVEEGPRRHEFLFSPGTVNRVKSYFNDSQALPYRETGPAVSPGLYEWYVSSPGHPLVARAVEYLPEWMHDQWFGWAVWQWVGLLLALLTFIVLMVVTFRLHGALTRRYEDSSVLGYALTIVFPIIAMLLPLVFRYVVVHYVTLRGEAMHALSFLSYLLSILASIVVVFAAGSRIAAIIISSPQINPQGLDAQLIRIIARISSISIAVIIFLAGGTYLGIPLTTLIASAGIGGLALALAAQDTLKNFFGTITLLMDNPFRIGERIIFGNYDGVVEEIGLRSTRVRLLTGHQATIPNSKLADSDLENAGRRPHIRRIVDIHVPLDTPREKIEQVLPLLRSKLESHEGIDAEFPPRVYFYDFTDRSFIIRVFYWYNPPEYWNYLAFSEKVNLEIFRAFEQQGIRFTPPYRITDVPGDGSAT